MIGQMAVLAQGPLPRGECVCAGSGPLQGSVGRQLYGQVDIVQNKRWSRGRRDRCVSGLSWESRSLPASDWNPREFRGGSGRDWGSNCSQLGLATETSTSDENPLATDSEEGAPMRKSSFIARVLRRLAGFLKKLSPQLLIRALVSFLRGRWRQIMLWTVVGTTIGLGYLCTKLTGHASPQVVPYSDLLDHLHSRTVSTVLFEEGSSTVYFNLVSGGETSAVVVNRAVAATAAASEERVIDLEAAGDGKLVDDAKIAAAEDSLLKEGQSVSRSRSKGATQQWEYSTRRIRNDELFLLHAMRDAGVKYSSAPQSLSATFRAVLITVITLWIPLSPLLWLLHRQLSQNSASSKKRRSVRRLVKFEDVAGIDTAKAELMEIVSCIKGASQFASLGAKLPKGILLVGPPGTGKTLLARAVAGEAGVPFFAASASEFVEMFVGRGAARIRELFAEARKNTPSIVFIDELDAVGGRRGRSFNDERDQTLNQLLTEMDGFESETGVLVLAATNRPEALDPALCRPGRLSRRVHVSEPDLFGRQQVLAVHMRGVPVQEDPIMLQRTVASMTAGFVGADLANLVNEAALLAARKGRSAVTLEDFKEAVDRAKFGVGDRRPNVFTEVEQKLGSWFNKSWSDPLGYPQIPSSG